MSNAVNIDINAIDNASATVNKVSSSAGGMAGAMQKASTIVTGLNSAMQVAGQVLRYVEQGYNATVGAAMEYDQQVLKLMASTGGTAEATSRLIQVMDDAGIGYDTVKIAMKELSKDGTEPTVQSLAMLSDEFLKLGSGADRGKFLLDKFGKSGQELARVMELGGAAILSMGNNVNDSLILTEDAISASEEYRMNLDTLNDSVESVKVSIGNGLIPVLNQIVQGMNNTSQAQDDYNRRLQASIEAHGDLGDRMNNMHVLMMAQGETIDSATTSYTAMAKAQEETSGATGNAGDAFEKEAEKIKAAKEELEAMTSVNKELFSLTQSFQSEYDNYGQSLASATAKQQELGMVLDEATAKYPANSEQVMEATAKYNEQSAAVAALGEEHNSAMQKIAYGLLVAKLQADGFTDAEFQMAMAAGVAMGQIDQSTADMAVKINDAANAALATNDVTMFTNAVPGIVAAGDAAAGVEANLQGVTAAGDAVGATASGINAVNTAAGAAGTTLAATKNTSDALGKGVDTVAKKTADQTKKMQTNFDSLNTVKAIAEVNKLINALYSIPTTITTTITVVTNQPDPSTPTPPTDPSNPYPIMPIPGTSNNPKGGASNGGSIAGLTIQNYGSIYINGEQFASATSIYDLFG